MKRVLAVIKENEVSYARQTTLMALECGVDGIILVGKYQEFGFMRQMYLAVQSEFPSLWVGLNYNDMCALEAFKACNDLMVDAVWSEQCLVDESGQLILELSELQTLRALHAQKEFFGSVPLDDYGPKVDPMNVVISTLEHVSSATMSASAPPERIAQVRSVIQAPHRLALSGVTTENVDWVLSYGDDYLVEVNSGHPVKDDRELLTYVRTVVPWIP